MGKQMKKKKIIKSSLLCYFPLSLSYFTTLNCRTIIQVILVHRNANWCVQWKATDIDPFFTYL